MKFSKDDDVWMCEREFCAQQTGCDECPVPQHNEEIKRKKKEDRNSYDVTKVIRDG